MNTLGKGVYLGASLVGGVIIIIGIYFIPLGWNCEPRELDFCTYERPFSLKVSTILGIIALLYGIFGCIFSQKIQSPRNQVVFILLVTVIGFYIHRSSATFQICSCSKKRSEGYFS